jgi:anti-sigma regulatory factor (Ser/Thr protein kinase)
MDYAYPEGTVGYVDIEADIDDTYITFVLSDSGMPFDPTQKEEVDTTLPAEQRKIGGLGIHLVRRIMDSVSYEYKDHKNILTLRKKISK